MLPSRFLEGATGSVAPSAFGGLLLALLLSACQPAPESAPSSRTAQDTPATSAPACPSDREGEPVRVVHVYDGDTVKLADGRRVRIIGINAPEVAREDRTGQPWATEATRALQSMIDDHGQALQLRYDTDRHDRYQRVLAHLFLPNGDNVAARLLAEGYATALVVPPNTWQQDCYREAETRARAAGAGLWALPGWQPKEAARLPMDTRGFSIVRGRVDEIRESRDATWIDLEGPLVVRVARKDETHFTHFDPHGLVGKTVEVRGWVREDRYGLRVSVRHPAALQALE